MLPRNDKNPAGGGRQVSEAMKAYEKQLSLFRRQLYAFLDTILVERVEPPKVSTELLANESTYLYQVDPERLRETVSSLFAQLMGYASHDLAGQAQAAYMVGAVTAEKSMMTLLDDTRELTKILADAPFLQRAAFVKARAFEEMKGFAGETATRLGTLLLEHMSDGRSIAFIKSKLKSEFDLTSRRAETIARTEVIGALRRGRVEQAQTTAEQFGVEVGLMWYSALSPTTRKTHAARHGKVYTADEVKKFYTEDGNAVNCKCAQVEVLMKDGKPIQEKLVSREATRRKAYLKEG